MKNRWDTELWEDISTFEGIYLISTLFERVN